MLGSRSKGKSRNGDSDERCMQEVKAEVQVKAEVESGKWKIIVLFKKLYDKKINCCFRRISRNVNG